jgi:hypothetical protein
MESQSENAVSPADLRPGTFYVHVIGVHGLDTFTVAPHSKKTIVGAYVGTHSPTGKLIFNLNGNNVHVPLKTYELYYKESIFGVKHAVHGWMEDSQKDLYHSENLHYTSMRGVSAFVPVEPPANLDLVVIQRDLIEGHSYKTCDGRRNHVDGLYYADGPFTVLGVYNGKESYNTFQGGHGEMYKFEDNTGRLFKYYLNLNGTSCFQQMNA